MVQNYLEAGPKERHMHRVSDQARGARPQIDLVIVCRI